MQTPNTPSPFSALLPGLQLIWDATSFRELLTCPRKYELRIKNGWVTPEASIDLEFGILAHKGKEVFERARAHGASKAEAQGETLDALLEASGTRDEGGAWSPWGGRYENVWRCTGTEPFRNANGNRAKCPYSHAGQWFPEPAPETCGRCGAPTESRREWVPQHATKHRNSVIEAVFWWTDDQPEDPAETLEVLKLPDGTPAVEMSFRVPLPYQTQDGERFGLAGYFDAAKALGVETFVTDTKTTKMGLTQAFWDTFTPHIQVDIYDLVGSGLFAERNFQGVLIEGIQVLQSAVRFGSHPIYRNEAQREEFLRELEYWLTQADKFARDGRWPRNRAACWRCEFRQVCLKPDAERDRMLEADFVKRHWNPLEER